jgi:hypothetical protein
MEKLHFACREALSQCLPTSSTLPEVQVDNHIALAGGLNQLWENIISQKITSNLDVSHSGANF